MSSVNAVQPRQHTGGGAAEGDGYIVKPGDSLWAISRAHNISLDALEKANPQFSNPNLIRPGQFVNIPQGAQSAAEAAPESYSVKSGDTLSEIGERFGMDWHVLAQLNNLKNPDLILPQQTLKIGGSGNSSSGSRAAGGGGSSPSGGAQPDSPGATSPVRNVGAPSGSEKGRIDQAMSFFQEQGWTRAQAAGIVANLQAESGVQHGRAQNGGGPGFGLAQWEGPRQADFKRWAGHDIHNSTFQEQLQFVQHELTKGSRANAGRALHGADSAGEAARIVCRLYEQPRDTVGQSAYRAQLAQQI